MVTTSNKMTTTSDHHHPQHSDEVVTEVYVRVSPPTSQPQKPPTIVALRTDTIVQVDNSDLLAQELQMHLANNSLFNEPCLVVLEDAILEKTEEHVSAVNVEVPGKWKLNVNDHLYDSQGKQVGIVYKVELPAIWVQVEERVVLSSGQRLRIRLPSEVDTG
jgi:predicted  nucleic acid-binding Zn-ribbon protein